MRAVIVYESMFGNTHAVAQHVAEGVDAVASTTVVSMPCSDNASAVLRPAGPAPAMTTGSGISFRLRSVIPGAS